MIKLQEWKAIINLQQELDAKITLSKSLNNEDIIHQRILALIVELSEFSNELRCFKYWSTRMTYDSKQRVLDEYVDCLHFIVSIGLTFKIDLEVYKYQSQSENDLTTLILMTMTQIINFWKEQATDYNLILDYFFTIAKILDFSFLDIYEAYVNKNQINHQRISNNY